MKAAFIIPKNDDQHQQSNMRNQSRIFPPVGLAPMAGIMGKHAKISLLDERMKSDIQLEFVQIAIIFINSYNQQRACELANWYQAQGSCVVLAGNILSNYSGLPTESADCLLIGSGAEHLNNFLVDYQTGKLKRIYRSSTRVNPRNQDNHWIDGSPLRLAS